MKLPSDVFCHAIRQRVKKYLPFNDHVEIEKRVSNAVAIRNRFGVNNLQMVDGDDDFLEELT